MSNKKEDIYFSSELSERERACFEAGIKLGALYHIMSGIPVASNETILSSIEKGIEAAISCQPYVESVNIELDRRKIKGVKTDVFDYDEITGEIIKAKIVLKYQKTRIIARVEWKEDLNYPLMYVEKITQLE
ncbi:MAG: dihydroneopterin aldolase family protein [Promethearchaeota archaeon]